ncbi:MAG: DUF2461 domain-containing protein [Pseudomonadota bacterium]
MASFDSFSPEALSFLSDLKTNNTKDWFATNKATYDIHLKEPGKQFADAMSLALRDISACEHDSKVFRIHRDVRFSKDKTPYNAHFHVAFMPKEQAGQQPMWFFGLSPKKLSLGCGVFQYDKEALVAFRSAMAGPRGAELIQLTTDFRAAGFRVGEPELKRVPSGFNKDHPHGEALRRKGFAVWIDVADPTFVTKPNFVKRATGLFCQIMPVFRLLSQVA